MQKLRFDSSQYKRYPRRPGLIYAKPYVMRAGWVFSKNTFYWFAGFAEDGTPRITPNKSEAVRVSAEQAGWLASKHFETITVTDLDTGMYHSSERRYIDVRRLPSSPNRFHPMTMRENLIRFALGIELRRDFEMKYTEDATVWYKIYAALCGREVGNCLRGNSHMIKIYKGLEPRIDKIRASFHSKMREVRGLAKKVRKHV